jgi:YHS domain-containing protein
MEVHTMLAQIIAFALLSNQPQLVCPVMGEAADMAGPKVEYNGAVFAFCCSGCDTAFSGDPAKILASPKVKGKNAGLYLFDPVSRNRVEAKAAKAFATYAGIVFPFESEANKAKFEKSPKDFGTLPKKEVLVCPVSGEKIESHHRAAAYRDVDGVRYYICCGDCVPEMDKDAKKHTAAHAKSAVTPKAHKVEDK